MSTTLSQSRQPWSRKTALAAAGVFALTLAGAGVAQPFGGPGGPGPGWGGGMGPHYGMGMGMGGMGSHPGMGMHGGPGAGGQDMFGPFAEKMLDAAKQRLNLTSAQQAAWDKAVANGKTSRETQKTNRQRVRDAMRAELAKLDPDF